MRSSSAVSISVRRASAPMTPTTSRATCATDGSGIAHWAMSSVLSPAASPWLIAQRAAAHSLGPIASSGGKAASNREIIAI